MVHSCLRRPMPSLPSAGQGELDEGQLPMDSAGRPSADCRPQAVAIGGNVAGVRLQAHGPISSPRLLDVRLARPTEPCRTCPSSPRLERLHLEWLAWACGAPTGAMSV